LLKALEMLILALPVSMHMLRVIILPPLQELHMLRVRVLKPLITIATLPVDGQKLVVQSNLLLAPITR
jgi:hypothetical protein